MGALGLFPSGYSTKSLEPQLSGMVELSSTDVLPNTATMRLYLKSYQVPFQGLEFGNSAPAFFFSLSRKDAGFGLHPCCYQKHQ